jgi:cell division inhibitor SepF
MAGAMRKMAVYLGLVEDEDERYYDDGYEPDGYGAHHSSYDEAAQRTSAVRRYGGPEEVEAASRPRGPYPAPTAVERVSHHAEDAPGHPQGQRETLRELSRITTLHPRTYNDARTIGEHFRAGTPVIMNLTNMDDTDAKRLVDFAAGLIFGLRGSIERVTNKVFLLSPQNVEVTAEAKAHIAEGGFFNQS